MHLALPPRKPSSGPPFAARTSPSVLFQRRRLQILAIIALACLSFIWLVSNSFSARAPRAPAGSPEVVIVTVIDEERGYSKAYIEKIKQNRRDYAKRHGYATFFPTTHDYDLDSAPWSWSVVPALRHASTAYPYTPWIFHLSMHALIMNPELSISKHITDPARLESLMQKDVPVVPPDSVIKTFSHLKGKQIDLILTQDGGALSHGSMLIRNFGGVDAQGKDEGADWARFFLDTWFNPLYRSYNFQKAEGHALEHIVQWHPTILAKIALVPQNIMNSYNQGVAGVTTSLYASGDFVVRLAGCDTDGSRNCEKEIEQFWALASKNST